MSAGNGPYLNSIVPGQSLAADPVQQNFQQTQDFLGAIPGDNLNCPFQTWTASGSQQKAVAINLSQFFGYQRIDTGGKQILLSTLSAYYKAANGITNPDTVIVELKKCTPAGAQPVATDVWSNIGTHPQWTSANTAAGNQLAGEATPTFAQFITYNAGIVLNDGDWIRWEVQTTGATSAITECGAAIAGKLLLRK